LTPGPSGPMVDGMPSHLKDLPSLRTADAIQAALAGGEPWFYDFRFSNGASTAVQGEAVPWVHRTRAEMIFPGLDEALGQAWSSTRCLDVACNEGWFSAQLAARGAAEVRGIDIREEHLRKARLIREISGLQTLAFERADILGMTPATHGTFGLTLLLGLLYHVENPLGVLRSVRALTAGICVIETQVARGSQILECRTVGAPGSRSGPAVALVPGHPSHVGPGMPLVLVPTLDALYAMLQAAGFQDVRSISPPADAYPHFKDLDRVVLFAR
jgi:tRNA (mo5U34)-methyltransferase